MITIEQKGNQIYLFGRDEKGNEYCEQKDFRPYFYIEDKNGKHKSILGKKLKKINCEYPYDVIVERMLYPNHYEADVLYVNRYIIDEIKKINKEIIRKCYIDIEIRRPPSGFDEPFKATSEILCIGCYDNFDKEYKQFVLKDYDDEREMLKDFIRYIMKTNPDMLIAWNGDNFDFPFLMNRIHKLKIKVNALARINKLFRGECKFKNKFGVKIEGRILFDLLYAYKKFVSGEGRESFSLDYVSQYEGIGEKEKYKGTLDDLYDKDIDKFIKYNLVDVKLMVELDDKLNLVEFFDNLRRICFCKFEDVFLNNRMADCLCLKYAKDNNFVLPSAQKNENKGSFTGGFVQKSIPGLHKNVACLDMKSLYPSIMIGFNTSYETILDEYKEGCLNGNDKYFYKKEIGIIPAIVKPLLERRANVKKEMYKIKDRNSREYKTKHMEQYTLKTTVNSFYGVLGYRKFRLYNKKVASSITYLSRMTIKEVTRWFEEKGFNVIYGDTDSIFCTLEDKSIEDFINLTKEINNYFKIFYEKFGIEKENNIIELQFEKVYKTIFFKGGKDRGLKKKYAGILIWEDGNDIYKYQRKGFESRRSDNPTIGRKFLDVILKMIVEEKSQEEIEKYISEFKEKLQTEVSPEDIAIPIGISKPLHNYANQIHARASRLANERHNAGIQRGDKIKYIYVKNEGKVIAFKSDKYLWDGYDIDYNRMIMRIINLKVGPIFDSLNWKHNYVTKLSSRKKKIKLLKDIMKQNELW